MHKSVEFAQDYRISKQNLAQQLMENYQGSKRSVSHKRRSKAARDKTAANPEEIPTEVERISIESISQRKWSRQMAEMTLKIYSEYPGLSYSIDFGSWSGSLDMNGGVWRLHSGGAMVYFIGKRKEWTEALREALAWIHQGEIERQHDESGWYRTVSRIAP